MANLSVKNMRRNLKGLLQDWKVNRIFGDLIMRKGTVTQGTSITTTVICNKRAGVITTFSSTLAANAAAVFTVTNSLAKSTSVILLTVEYPAASNGSPHARVAARADGSFNIELCNVDASAALNGAVKIHYAILSQ